VQAAVGSHCLDCAKAARPDVNTRVKLASSRLMTPVTSTLIAVNLAIFAIMAAADSGALGGSRITKLQVDLGVSRSILQGHAGAFGKAIPAHQWYRLVTAGFIHFGVLHIVMNMLLLFQLGNLLERALGSARLAAVYFASLLAGSLGVIMLDGHGLSGGASGAVFGLMTAAAVGLHRRGVNVFSTGIGMTLGLNLVLTFTIPGISIGGHVGGIVAGGICGWVMMAPSWKPSPKWAIWAAPAAVAAVAVLGSVLLVG
jgi:membrane associated rhomboid family serine protease